MKKEDKERVVAELTGAPAHHRDALVADYRGLTMPQIDDLRSKLIEHGARFRSRQEHAHEACGRGRQARDALLAMLEGPTAIAFLESDGDPVAVAKALVDAARDTRVLEVRGRPARRQADRGRRDRVAWRSCRRSTCCVQPGAGARSLRPGHGDRRSLHGPGAGSYGLLDARIEQLREQGDTSEAAAEWLGARERRQPWRSLLPRRPRSLLPKTARWLESHKLKQPKLKA